METVYKVTMLNDNPEKHWIVMDSGDEKEMLKTLKYYRESHMLRKFRLEKHTMEVIDES